MRIGLAVAAALVATNLPAARAQPAGEPAPTEANLAQKLQNSVVDLINVPFKNNSDYGGGAKADLPEATEWRSTRRQAEHY